ncbi:Transcription factor TFIIA complex subunit Toa1 [Spraguea lophii 42_110]|uniref:Transcription factor TFIIA complex subunit Toa1 n=1 Tax=Spraguea lophii (strain 42_110) TaxID=1358809 RepID=S7W4U3_SPRLO|nr:Transcription factor TFIIA complex subunit Toa1 [Spraguea lophii 42_110]
MNYEMSRIYRDIIDEVCRSLESDATELYFDSNTIADLKKTWTQKLKGYIEKGMVEDNTPKFYGHIPLKGFMTRGNAGAHNVNSPNKNLPECEDSSEEQELENMYNNNMICLYEKVSKTKNKWRCTFKHGFINLGNRDYAFNSAIGELEW